MKKRSKFGEFMYDFIGGIIVIFIILGGVFCCSSTVRTFAKDTVENFMKEDTVKSAKPKLHKDSVTIIRDTIKVKNQEVTNADTIALKKGKDGLYYLPLKINGIPMKFALDTGCSGMSMSAVEYLFLKHQGLVKEHTNVECVSTMANGETEKGFVTTLDSVKIGNKTITNVECNVSPNQDASLLLGQEVLSKLGNVTIKYNKEILLVE